MFRRQTELCGRQIRAKGPRRDFDRPQHRAHKAERPPPQAPRLDPAHRLQPVIACHQAITGPKEADRPHRPGGSGCGWPAERLAIRWYIGDPGHAGSVMPSPPPSERRDRTASPPSPIRRLSAAPSCQCGWILQKGCKGDMGHENTFETLNEGDRPEPADPGRSMGQGRILACRQTRTSTRSARAPTTLARRQNISDMTQNAVNNTLISFTISR